MAGRYRVMLMALTPERRVRMVSDMWDAATQLSLATVDGSHEAEVRIALFLRRYGHEFDAEERQRIIDRLRQHATRQADACPTLAAARRP